VNRDKDDQPPRANCEPRFAARVASLLAVATLIVAVVNILSVTPFPWLPHVLISPTSVHAHANGGVTILLVGVGLLFLANQLRKQKRRAWQVALVLSSVATVAHIVHGSDYLAVGVSALVLVCLVAARHVFVVPGDPLSASRCARIATLYFAAVFVYGLVLLWLMRGTLDQQPSLAGMVRTVAVGLVGVDGPYELAPGFLGAFFDWSLLVLGLGGAVFAAVMLFRPHVHRHNFDEEDFGRARALVESYGSDTLSYFALRRDKSYFFSSDGRAMIPYAYRGGCALASADPIGDPGSIPLVVDEFMEMCRDRAWGVAFLAAREEDAQMYKDRGLLSYYLGDEAIVDCERFSLVGRPIRKVRQSVNRLEKAGFSFELLDHTHWEEVREDFVEVSRKWQGNAPERGFTMALGRLSESEDVGCLIAVARDPDGAARGFLHLVPFGGERAGYSLDAMRRDPATPNGLMEYMVCKTVAALKERGTKRLSLNFAAYARLLDADAGELSAFWKLHRWIVKKLNPFFQIESLHSFNKKFFPDWQPRCIYYDSRWNAVRIGVLYGEVETLVSIPLLRRMVDPTPRPGRRERRRPVPSGAGAT